MNIQATRLLVAKVDECARWFLADCTRLGEIELASKAFAYTVRNHPYHPAFDRLEREGVNQESIAQALHDLSSGCRWDFDRKHGAVVVAPGWMGYRYDPVHLITAGEDVVVAFSGSSQYRVEKIIVETLEEAKQHFISTGLLDLESMHKLERRLQVWRTRFEYPACED
jgi:hypothetical protein